MLLLFLFLCFLSDLVYLLYIRLTSRRAPASARTARAGTPDQLVSEVMPRASAYTPLRKRSGANMSVTVGLHKRNAHCGKYHIDKTSNEGLCRDSLHETCVEATAVASVTAVSAAAETAAATVAAATAAYYSYK